VRQYKLFRRLRRAAVSGLVMLTVLAVGAGIFARDQRDEAIVQRAEAIVQRDRSEARRLAAVSEANSAEQTDLAHLLALESLHVSETKEGWAALFESLSRPVMARSPMTGHTKAVSRVAFSPVDSQVASASLDGSVRLWNVELDRQSYVLGVHEGSVDSLAFSEDGRLLASGDNQGGVLLWDVVKRQQMGKLATTHDGVVWDLAFSPDGRWLASACGDGWVRLWSVDLRTMIWKQRGNESDDLETKRVLKVAFDADGSRLASASLDGTVRLWDLKGNVIATPPTGMVGWQWGMAFNRDLSLFAVATEDNSIRLWNLKTRKVVHQLIGHDDEVRALAFSPVKGDTRLASVGLDGTVRLWDAALGKAMVKPMTGHDNAVFTVGFSPHGTSLASGSLDATVRLWDLEAGAKVGKVLAGHAWPNLVALSADGAFVASASLDNKVRLWDAALDRQIGDSLDHGSRVKALAFSPKKSLLATGGADGKTRLWSVSPDGQVTHHVARPSGRDLPLTGQAEVTTLVFSADGSRLATAGGSKGVLRIWDVDSHLQVGETPIGHGKQVLGIAFSGDGKFLASSGAGGVILWDVTRASVEPVWKRVHNGIVWAVTFDPDDARVFSVAEDGIRQWDVTSGEQVGKTLAPPQDREAWVQSAAFSDDGRLVATTNEGGTIRLWDSITGKSAGEPLQGHDDLVLGLAFSPDTMLLASVSGDYTIRLWKAQTRWPALACSAARRPLTKEEWRRLVDEDIGTYRPLCPPSELGRKANMGWPARRGD